MLDHEVLQVWIWDILLGHTTGGGTVRAMSMEHFKYSILKGWHSRDGCYTWNEEGTNVLKYIVCIGFPKFIVYVVFVNTMLFISMNNCWILGPPRLCAGASKSL